tara:strand:+ start:483 stop:1142 length:660 start_codon:yes stop_codon:yes gene_type:complete
MAAERMQNMLSVPLAKRWQNENGDALTEQEVLLAFYDFLPLNLKTQPSVVSVYAQTYVTRFEHESKEAHPDGEELAGCSIPVLKEILVQLDTRFRTKRSKGTSKFKKEELIERILAPAESLNRTSRRTSRPRKRIASEEQLDALAAVDDLEAVLDEDAVVLSGDLNGIKLTLANLKYLCRERDLTGYSRKSKEELLEMLGVLEGEEEEDDEEDDEEEEG